MTDLLDRKVQNLVRKRYLSGKKTVVIDKTLFKIRAYKRTAEDKEGHKVKQTWIVVKPASGMLPIANIPLDERANSKIL